MPNYSHELRYIEYDIRHTGSSLLLLSISSSRLLFTISVVVCLRLRGCCIYRFRQNKMTLDMLKTVILIGGPSKGMTDIIFLYEIADSVQQH